jgi:hypothetical protein
MTHYNERGVRHGANMGSGTFGESPASGPAPTTSGHHKHDILNKLDPRVDSTQDRRPVASMMGGDNNVPAGTYGPHSSRIANALDPRVDSDMDHRGTTGTGPTMHGGATAGRQQGGGMLGSGNTQGAPEGSYGPHSSRIANALDPRVDSDRDNRGAAGYNGGGAMPSAAAGATGYGPSTAGAGYGPASGAGGYGQSAVGGLGHHHQQQPQQGYGAEAGAGNMDTRTAAAMSGPGPAPNTAGPHRSDLLNKLDPRVDSKTGLKKEPGYTERRGI